MRAYPPIGGIRTVEEFKEHLAALNLPIPCDVELQTGPESTLAQPIKLNDKIIGNRFCIHPMEGWDGTADGKPSEATIRRWRNFGLSGAK
jgi:NADPH2 dehydrogenase